MSERGGGEGRARQEEAERRELEEAGWVLVERVATEKIIWRNPESGHLYTQESALARVRERARRGERFGDSGEGSW